jgi:hypothetical protein
MIDDFTLLPDSALDQQRGAYMTVAITATVRTLMAQSVCGLKDALTRLCFQYSAGRT